MDADFDFDVGLDFHFDPTSQEPNPDPDHDASVQAPDAFDAQWCFDGTGAGAGAGAGAGVEPKVEMDTSLHGASVSVVPPPPLASSHAASVLGSFPPEIAMGIPVYEARLDTYGSAISTQFMEPVSTTVPSCVAMLEAVRAVAPQTQSGVAAQLQQLIDSHPQSDVMAMVQAVVERRTAGSFDRDKVRQEALASVASHSFDHDALMLTSVVEVMLGTGKRVHLPPCANRTGCTVHMVDIGGDVPRVENRVPAITMAAMLTPAELHVFLTTGEAPADICRRQCIWCERVRADERVTKATKRHAAAQVAFGEPFTPERLGDEVNPRILLQRFSNKVGPGEYALMAVHRMTTGGVTTPIAKPLAGLCRFVQRAFLPPPEWGAISTRSVWTINQDGMRHEATGSPPPLAVGLQLARDGMTGPVSIHAPRWGGLVGAGASLGPDPGSDAGFDLFGVSPQFSTLHSTYVPPGLANPSLGLTSNHLTWASKATWAYPTLPPSTVPVTDPPHATPADFHLWHSTAREASHGLHPLEQPELPGRPVPASLVERVRAHAPFGWSVPFDPAHVLCHSLLAIGGPLAACSEWAWRAPPRLVLQLAAAASPPVVPTPTCLTGRPWADWPHPPPTWWTQGDFAATGPMGLAAVVLIRVNVLDTHLHHLAAQARTQEPTQLQTDSAHATALLLDAYVPFMGALQTLPKEACTTAALDASGIASWLLDHVSGAVVEPRGAGCSVPNVYTLANLTTLVEAATSVAAQWVTKSTPVHPSGRVPGGGIALPGAVPAPGAGVGATPMGVLLQSRPKNTARTGTARQAHTARGRAKQNIALLAMLTTEVDMHATGTKAAIQRVLTLLASATKADIRGTDDCRAFIRAALYLGMVGGYPHDPPHGVLPSVARTAAWLQLVVAGGGRGCDRWLDTARVQISKHNRTEQLFRFAIEEAAAASLATSCPSTVDRLFPEATHGRFLRHLLVAMPAMRIAVAAQVAARTTRPTASLHVGPMPVPPEILTTFARPLLRAGMRHFAFMCRVFWETARVGLPASVAEAAPTVSFVRLPGTGSKPPTFVPAGLYQLAHQPFGERLEFQPVVPGADVDPVEDTGEPAMRTTRERFELAPVGAKSKRAVVQPGEAPPLAMPRGFIQKNGFPQGKETKLTRTMREWSNASRTFFNTTVEALLVWGRSPAVVGVLFQHALLGLKLQTHLTDPDVVQGGGVTPAVVDLLTHPNSREAAADDTDLYYALTVFAVRHHRDATHPILREAMVHMSGMGLHTLLWLLYAASAADDIQYVWLEPAMAARQLLRVQQLYSLRYPDVAVDIDLRTVAFMLVCITCGATFASYMTEDSASFASDRKRGPHGTCNLLCTMCNNLPSARTSCATCAGTGLEQHCSRPLNTQDRKGKGSKCNGLCVWLPILGCLLVFRDMTFCMCEFCGCITDVAFDGLVEAAYPCQLCAIHHARTGAFPTVPEVLARQGWAGNLPPAKQVVPTLGTPRFCAVCNRFLGPASEPCRVEVVLPAGGRQIFLLCGAHATALRRSEADLTAPLTPIALIRACNSQVGTKARTRSHAAGATALRAAQEAFPLMDPLLIQRHMEAQTLPGTPGAPTSVPVPVPVSSPLLPTDSTTGPTSAPTPV